MKKVFIDGETGTTGLQVRERLIHHPHITVISIDPAKKRDVAEKRRLMKEADVTVLCLPDDAAKDSILLAKEENCRVLDASSVHRVAEGWVYGLPELDITQRDKIKDAQFVSNPGCYPTGAVLLLKPLIEAGLLPADGDYSINAISGYSGGGNALIDRYESTESAPLFGAYGLSFNHKHLAEMKVWGGLSKTPIFVPSVGHFRQGMLTFLPIYLRGDTTMAQLHAKLADTYANDTFVTVNDLNLVVDKAAPFLTPHDLENTNQVELSVLSEPNGQSGVLVAKLDNLGKGASGAAVQNLNIMLGFAEDIAVNLR
ncbi:N-acetyl-gamma-glutamyl-phosphate reductase [Marinomonas sp. IMCC 4694]|uniref:N-acetyl-gamma-glutamyl-phosphate reductase n=1 Tax=Marinomonas sp. IMCC 4694 TaxID=2605432 RepID=UPI0011E71307|nr:N-acetyl-gamma-glutamyl-phosphate reductase [Marinomonas sp. IMCC 4694]TYL48373.1 N-acetyl-gamma-glutamyl-phosphate reductase [Marinomonas sp. IMCC 4694]